MLEAIRSSGVVRICFWRQSQSREAPNDTPFPTALASRADAWGLQGAGRRQPLAYVYARDTREVYPFHLSFKSNPAEWDYQRGLEKDFANSDCLKYVNSDFASLKEPPFGEGGICWHLYTSRFFDRKKYKVPYTLDISWPLLLVRD
jgi:hypothetical protein